MADISDSTDIAVSSLAGGPGYTFWAVIGSATFAGIIALLVVTQQRLITKKRAAYDLIVRLNSSPMREYEHLFYELAESKKLLTLSAPTTSEEVEKQLKVKSYLNMLETLSVSIKMNIVDENICKAIIGDTLVKKWQMAYPLIKKIREDEGDDEFFEHFQDIAKKWKDHPMLERRWWLITLIREISRI